jgi:nucleoside-diphosphate-sugar epimerase
MKVLITGATGFIGGHLAETLAGRGYEVRALVQPTSNGSLLKEWGVEIFRGDIKDAAAVGEAARGCDHVYHLAAKRSHLRLPLKEFYRVNVEGVENIARAALKARVKRLVHVSSAGIYGTSTRPPIDENSRSHPNTFYRESKCLAEEVVLRYIQEEQLPAVIVRPSMVLGRRSLSWIHLFRAIVRGGFRVIGSGANHLHPGHVSDIIEGIRRAAETERIEGRSYILTGREPISVREFVNLIAEAAATERPRGSLPRFPFFLFHSLAEAVRRTFRLEVPQAHRYELFLSDTIFDISRAKKELGYSPAVSVKQAVQETVQWYREQGYLSPAS